MYYIFYYRLVTEMKQINILRWYPIAFIWKISVFIRAQTLCNRSKLNIERVVPVSHCCLRYSRHEWNGVHRLASLYFTVICIYCFFLLIFYFIQPYCIIMCVFLITLVAIWFIFIFLMGDQIKIGFWLCAKKLTSILVKTDWIDFYCDFVCNILIQMIWSREAEKVMDSDEI